MIVNPTLKTDSSLIDILNYREEVLILWYSLLLAREEKDYVKADEYKKTLTDMGFEIQLGKDGGRIQGFYLYIKLLEKYELSFGGDRDYYRIKRTCFLTKFLSMLGLKTTK